MTLLSILPVALAACQTKRTVTIPDGATYTDNGHLAGNTTVVIKGDTVIMHNKMNQPWQDAMQLIGAVASVKSGENVAEAAVASSKAKSLAATRAGVAKAREATQLEKLKLASELEKFRILNPVQLPATPP